MSFLYIHLRSVSSVYFFFVKVPAHSLVGILTGCSVCRHSVRDDFTTQARLIYVGKALRAPTESVERIRRPSKKLVMANQQPRPPTDRCQDQLRQSDRLDGLVCLIASPKLYDLQCLLAESQFRCECFSGLKSWPRPWRQHAHEKDVLEGFEFMLRL